MRVINIVDSVDKVNYGIWHAAIVNADILARHGIETELWYPDSTFKSPENVKAIGLPILTINELKNKITDRKLDPSKDIIVTHGSWRYPTRWGAWLKEKGFHWVYVPQGMLEPWSMKQKLLKKKIYYNLFEKRLVLKADFIRAVSFPESGNLKRLMPNTQVKFIPNGVQVEEITPKASGEDKICRYLFLSRLHNKKNVVAIANAWLQSRLNNNPKYEFLIAGPDQGELEKLEPLIIQSQNIKYIGSVYGEQKMNVMTSCTFYILPSFSEGLPSSLLEAMSVGLLPIVSEGCNFPEVFTQQLGIKVGTTIESIKNVLEETLSWNEQQIHATALKVAQYIKDHYSIESISAIQIDLFKKLLNNKK
jgi:glycosyltransferase involved in cell wall biosynthesis